MSGAMNKKRTFASHALGLTFVALALSAVASHQQSPGLPKSFAENGLPPQSGEHVVSNNEVDLGNHQFGIEGVCRVEPDSALCWKPDGSPNEHLTDSLNRGIKSQNQEYRTFSVVIGKKNRVLVTRERRENSGTSLGDGTPMNPNYSKPGFAEGWGRYGGTTFWASASDFDGSSTSWSTMGGAFNKDTKEFPFRYVVTHRDDKPHQIPLHPGQFEVGGNVFEVISITEHKTGKDGPFYGEPANPIKPKTDIQVKVVSVANPMKAFSAMYADGKGNPISYVDKDGNPVNDKIVQEWMNHHQSGGRPLASPYIYANGMSFDPMYQQPGAILNITTYLRKDLCTSLLVTESEKEIYVFDHIKLDPN